MTRLEVGFGDGSKNLDVMTAAQNYNSHLLREVSHAMVGRRRILDFGAGRGTFAMPLRDQGHEVICVETECVLRSMLAAGGLEVHASLADIPNGSVDAAYTLNVLEHVRDDEEALAQLYMKIAKGGQFYVYVPAFEMLYSAMDYDVGHFRRYRLADLVNKCRRCGFKVKRAGYSDSLGFWASLAYKAAGPRDGRIPLKSLVLYDTYVFPISCVLDKVFSRLFGKNVWVMASRDNS